MKLNRIIALGWLTGSLLGGYCYATAQDEVPCLIFTGRSDTEQRIDLAKLNRITFDSDGMTVSSSKNSGAQDVRLLYSLFNRIEIGDAVPTGSAGIEEIGIDENSRLLFHADEKSILLESASELPYEIGIFSLKGTLIATSRMCAGQHLSLEQLPTGAYIAVATNGESKLTLKFILN